MIRTPDAIPARAGVGRGVCGAHHGELLQGVFDTDFGSPVVGLVTLPILGPHTMATFRQLPGTRAVSLASPGSKPKALRAAMLTLQRYAPDAPGGVLTLNSDVPAGVGMGSSTSDVVATVRAVAASIGHRLTARCVAALALEAEQAVDPLMFSRGVRLFASRQAQTIALLGRRLPPLTIVSINVSPTGLGVDTLACAIPTCSVKERETYAGLVRRLRAALYTGDVAELGAVTTRSAMLHAERSGSSNVAELWQIGQRAGAIGIQVAHTGSVVGLLFPGIGTSRRSVVTCRKHLEAEEVRSKLFRCASSPVTVCRFKKDV